MPVESSHTRTRTPRACFKPMSEPLWPHGRPTMISRSEGCAGWSTRSTPTPGRWWAISLAALARLGEQLEDVRDDMGGDPCRGLRQRHWGTAARIWSTFTCSSNLQHRPNHSPTTVDVLAGLACTTRSATADQTICRQTVRGSSPLGSTNVQVTGLPALPSGPLLWSCSNSMQQCVCVPRHISLLY